MRKELAEKKAESEKEEVWSDLKRSQQIAAIESKTDTFDAAEKAISDTEEILALLEEEQDDSLVPDLEKELSKAAQDIEDMHLKALLGGKYDACNAIMTLHAGAAARRRATGFPCCTACICATASGRALRCTNSTV